MKDSLEEAAERLAKHFNIDFIEGAKWQQEQHNFLPGFIKQFDPKEGEINGEEWTAVHFLKWLELNKFKIVK